ncbi:hypothetical protein NDU88_006958 [Pleurodeles waltl]|uniref:Uncharacterized protein n=1 Tax=Pleurodeles waltl TaxID=8319 RepID=A0AAV7N0Q3_PLEWA|nr:hypothetical protein NDU88_006958 [Pleurodeles waltl]
MLLGSTAATPYPSTPLLWRSLPLPGPTLLLCVRQHLADIPQLQVGSAPCHNRFTQLRSHVSPAYVRKASCSRQLVSQ